MSVSDLQCASLVVLGVDPRSEGELCDEDLSRLGKQDWSLCTDHLHIRDGVTAGQKHPQTIKHQAHTSYTMNDSRVMLMHLFKKNKKTLTTTNNKNNNTVTT